MPNRMDGGGPSSPLPERFMSGTDQKLAVIISDLKDIKPQVRDTNIKVAEVKTELKAIDDRVTKVEVKVEDGHKCLIPDVISDLKSGQKESTDKINTDVQKGIAQEEKLKSLAKDAASIEADVEDIKKGPRRMFYSMLGIIVTVAMSAGGGVWFLSKLDSKLEAEREQRTLQITNIEKQIDAVGDIVDPSPIQEEVSELREVVQVSNGHEEEYNGLCEDARPYTKRFLREDLMKRGKRVPSSCLE